MQVTHVGQQGELYVEAFDDVVQPGETVSVKDADFARALLDQPDNWAPADAEGEAYLAERDAGQAANEEFAAGLAEWAAAVEAERAQAAADAAPFHRISAVLADLADAVDELVAPTDDVPDFEDEADIEPLTPDI